MTKAAEQAYVPPEGDVLKSAVLAIEEIRRQIDHQSEDAGSLDTKATAALTLLAAVIVLAAPPIHLDTTKRQVAAVVATFVTAGLLVCIGQALRPRKGFSYGPEPAVLVSIIQGYAHTDVAIRVAESLVEARAKNVEFLSAKGRWLGAALGFVSAEVVALIGMLYTGALG